MQPILNSLNTYQIFQQIMRNTESGLIKNSEKILALERSSRQKIVNKFDGIALLIHSEMNGKASNLVFEIDQKSTAIWIKPSR